MHTPEAYNSQLRNLAAPMELPDALPSNVPLALGIIANSPSGVPGETARAHIAGHNYNESLTTAEHIDWLAKLEERRARGPVSTERVAYYAKRITRDAVTTLEAHQHIAALKPDLPLAREIVVQEQSLSRRGRSGTVVAGFVLGVTAGIGMFAAAGPAPEISSTIAQESIEGEHQRAAAASHTTKVVLSGLLPLIGLTSGIGASRQFAGHFARRRARQHVNQATSS